MIFPKSILNLLLIVILSLLYPYSALSWLWSGSCGKSDKVEEKLVGPVQSVSLETNLFLYQSDRWIEGTRYLSYTTSYDVRGNIIERTSYTNNRLPDGISRWNITYDDNNNIIEKATDMTLGVRDSSLVTKEVYTYNNRSITQKVYLGEPSQLRRVLLCDINGNPREETSYAKTGSIDERIEYIYDKNGWNTEKLFYSSDGVMISKWIHTYDGKGNKVASSLFNPDGSVLKGSEFLYNARGDITEIREYDNKRSLISIERFNYEYDSMGNWIKRVSSIWLVKKGKPDFEPSHSMYRKITYY